jgi:hypothetical protein
MRCLIPRRCRRLLTKTKVCPGINTYTDQKKVGSSLSPCTAFVSFMETTVETIRVNAVGLDVTKECAERDAQI